MANDLRIVLAAAAFAAAGLAHSSASAQSTSNTADQSNLRDRIAAAVEMIEGACATDVRNFCGNVTRGEGRLVLCMQAYDDQLSKRCQFALYRVSRNLGSVLSRVDRIADACWNDIQENVAMRTRSVNASWKSALRCRNPVKPSSTTYSKHTRGWQP